ncbi:hypothetical protein NMY22_g17209 [Coprinellus aureogranulatus]|nr:hypothetical protein NMY22_g17209 [Coprinellus aureogranulatus]
MADGRTLQRTTLSLSVNQGGEVARLPPLVVSSPRAGRGNDAAKKSPSVEGQSLLATSVVDGAESFEQHNRCFSCFGHTPSIYLGGSFLHEGNSFTPPIETNFQIPDSCCALILTNLNLSTMASILTASISTISLPPAFDPCEETYRLFAPLKLTLKQRMRIRYEAFAKKTKERVAFLRLVVKPTPYTLDEIRRETGSRSLCTPNPIEHISLSPRSLRPEHRGRASPALIRSPSTGVGNQSRNLEMKPASTETPSSSPLFELFQRQFTCHELHQEEPGVAGTQNVEDFQGMNREEILWLTLAGLLGRVPGLAELEAYPHQRDSTRVLEEARCSRCVPSRLLNVDRLVDATRASISSTFAPSGSPEVNFIPIPVEPNLSLPPASGTSWKDSTTDGRGSFLWAHRDEAAYRENRERSTQETVLPGGANSGDWRCGVRLCFNQWASSCDQRMNDWIKLLF